MQNKIQSFITDLKSNNRLSAFDEASTKQAVVLRMLSFLGWDIFNVEEVYPDYAANSSNVSYALRIGGLNKVFVEVKKISEKLDDHQEKFVNLASKEDTDFAVLTNGITWWFYLTSAKVSWQQKWFCTADFFDQEPDTFIPQLVDLLAMENVANGQALETAKNIFSDKNQKIAADFLPKAWNQIISQPNNVLVELLSLQTENLCGYKVDFNSIETFLSDHVDEWLITNFSTTALEYEKLEIDEKQSQETSEGSDDTEQEQQAESYADKSIKSFTFIGHSYIVRAWDEVLSKLCDYFASAHEKDFEKVLWISDNQKPYFSRYSDQLRIPEKVQDTDIFVETRINPDEVVKTAYKLVETFGYDDDDLSIDAR